MRRLLEDVVDWVSALVRWSDASGGKSISRISAIKYALF